MSAWRVARVALALLPALSPVLLPSLAAHAGNPVEANPPKPGAGFDFAPEEDPARERFKADHWSRGLHLLAGLGANTSFYRSDAEDAPVAAGVGWATAAGYVFTPSVMLEISSNVGLRRLKRAAIWDTVFGPGVRFRLPWVSSPAHTSLYGRAFTGWGMEVRYPYGSGERTHVTGPVGGLGGGILQGTARGTVWFAEVVGYVHFFQHRYRVQQSGDLPSVVGERPVVTETGAALTVSVGILVF